MSARGVVLLVVLMMLAAGASRAAAQALVYSAAGVDSLALRPLASVVFPGAWQPGRITAPLDLTTMSDGRLAVLDSDLGIVVLGTDGTLEALADARELTRGDFPPERIATLANGSLLVTKDSSILEVSSAGVQRVAGVGSYSGESRADGISAVRAKVWARDTAGLPAGGFILADAATGSVRGVDADGIVSDFAGNRRPGRPAEGAPAREAPLPQPRAVAALGDGTVLVASDDDVIRSVGPDGRVVTVAGGGSVRAGSSGAVPAPLVRFRGIRDLAVLSPGDVAVLDADGVYRAGADGTVMRLTGVAPADRWYEMPYQDGRLASAATLDGSARAVAADPAGGVLVATTQTLTLVAPDSSRAATWSPSVPTRCSRRRLSALCLSAARAALRMCVFGADAGRLLKQRQRWLPAAPYCRFQADPCHASPSSRSTCAHRTTA